LPEPLIYQATNLATDAVPCKSLVGNRKSAQAYVDKVTHSKWWKTYDHVPPRIWVKAVPDDTVGGLYYKDDENVIRKKVIPDVITLGNQKVYAGRRAVADPWVILHEVAHVLGPHTSTEGHHGRGFTYAYIALVYRWLDAASGDALVQGCKDFGIRINYRLLSD
jgi:hypothetical protein